MIMLLYLNFLKDIDPQFWHRQSPIVYFSRPEKKTFSIDYTELRVSETSLDATKNRALQTNLSSCNGPIVPRH